MDTAQPAALSQPLLTDTIESLPSPSQPPSVLPVSVQDSMSRDSPTEATGSDWRSTSGEAGPADASVHPAVVSAATNRIVGGPEVDLVGCCTPNFTWDDFWYAPGSKSRCLVDAVQKLKIRYGNVCPDADFSPLGDGSREQMRCKSLVKVFPSCFSLIKHTQA